MPRPRLRHSSHRERSPAFPVAVCFAAGIALDRWLLSGLGCTTPPLLLAAGLLLLCWFALRRRSGRLASLLLLLAVVGTGSVWHHRFWQEAAADDIGRYVTEAPRPFDFDVVLESAGQIREASLPRFATAWPDEEKTRFTGRVIGFRQSRQLIPASGKVLITVVGVATGYGPGDRVRIRGTLRQLAPPRNPASFHFAHAQRQQGIRIACACRTPEAIVRVPASSPGMGSLVSSWLAALRGGIRGVYASHLSPEVVGIANALVLGERDRLEDETRQNFQQSGMMHMLSISGLHVGLVGLLFFLCGRAANFSPASLAGLTLAGMTLCLLLAEARPPVLRAWLVGMVVVAGWRCGRRVRLSQSLALSAWLLLIVNPSWLFDTGAQLSILAIVAICLSASMLPAWFRGNEASNGVPEPEDLAGVAKGSGFELLGVLSRGVGQALFLSLMITLLALPLLGHAFHRVTLAGIPASLVALPLLTVLLGLLLLLAVVGACSTWLASLIAWPVQQLLELLRGIAGQFADAALLTWPSPRPDFTALCLLYACGIILLLATSLRGRRVALLPLIAWTLLLPAVIEGPRGLAGPWGGSVECRVLSVGHGNACLLRSASGRCFLLDAGSMENGRVAADIILANLADMQADRIEAIIISHTDSDHLNAVPFLLERLPVRAVLLNPVGLNPAHGGMRAVVETAYSRGVSLRLLQPRDRIAVDDSLELFVLQGPSDPREGFGNDNADSLVVEARSHGRRLLFPGDVSGEGQQELTQRASGPFDLLVAPHHGSMKDNSPAFASWARPRAVCVSSGFSVVRESLRTSYGPEPLLLFTPDGALRTVISPGGTLRVDQWQREQRWRQVRSWE